MINSKIKYTLQMTSLLFFIITICSYIGWHLGYEGFIIVGDIYVPEFIRWIIAISLFLLNTSLFGGFVLDIYSLRILKYSIPITIIVYILNIFMFGDLISGPIATFLYGLIYIFLKLYKKESWIIWDFIRLPLASIILLSYNWISSQISQVDLSYSISFYASLRLSIDANILMLLLFVVGWFIYLNRKEHKYARTLEYVVFPGRERSDRCGNESGSDVSQDQSYIYDVDPEHPSEKWLMSVVILAIQVLQWIFILWVCSLDNLFLEALVMTTSFICHGLIINKRQHISPIILCTLAATAMFYFAARFSLPVQYSQLFPIIIGLMLVYILFRISYQFDQQVYERLKKERERLDQLAKKVDEAWEILDQLYK